MRSPEDGSLSWNAPGGGALGTVAHALLQPGPQVCTGHLGHWSLHLLACSSDSASGKSACPGFILQICNSSRWWLGLGW